MVFTAKTQLIDQDQKGRIERALARWKETWDISRVTRAASRHTGFMVHGEEVWLLARKMLRSDVSKLISRFEVDDMSQVRRWLAELG